MESPSKSSTLDVRDIIAKGEEPFAAIRSSVDALGPGDSLEIIAPFMPAPLIELLKSEGFEANMEHRPDGAWSVRFQRP
tara:strand:+ start:339 stop:575 length:237 start_codon:yes stop_codon:yes gene_type:complete